MADGTIQDSQLTASRDGGSTWVVTNGRLDDTYRSWYPGVNDGNQWMQVDLLEPMDVSGVILQGRYDSNQYVTKYKVLYSQDGSNFDYVQDSEGNTEVIMGRVEVVGGGIGRGRGTQYKTETIMLVWWSQVQKTLRGSATRRE